MNVLARTRGTRARFGEVRTGAAEFTSYTDENSIRWSIEEISTFQWESNVPTIYTSMSDLGTLLSGGVLLGASTSKRLSAPTVPSLITQINNVARAMRSSISKPAAPATAPGTTPATPPTPSMPPVSPSSPTTSSPVSSSGLMIPVGLAAVALLVLVSR